LRAHQFGTHLFVSRCLIQVKLFAFEYLGSSLRNLDVLNWKVEDSRVVLIELHVVEEKVDWIGRELQRLPVLYEWLLVKCE
jgi:hypothetical protein